MLIGALAQEHRHGLAQFGQSPVPLHQFLAGVLVLTALDQFADRLAQSLDRQCHVVAHQVRSADAQLRPCPALGGATRPP